MEEQVTIFFSTIESRDNPHENTQGKGETFTYYYDRNKRLQKLRTNLHPPKKGFFRVKRRRNLLILLVDIIIIAGVLYFLNRPVNVYEKRILGKVQYELNVTTIKGKKVLVGVTVTNIGSRVLKLGSKTAIVVTVSSSKKGKVYPPLRYTKYFEPNTSLNKNESDSVVFFLEESKLPRLAFIVVGIDDHVPIFQKSVRFSYMAR